LFHPPEYFSPALVVNVHDQLASQSSKNPSYVSPVGKVKIPYPFIVPSLNPQL
jgi:hypothetical protein